MQKSALIFFLLLFSFFLLVQPSVAQAEPSTKSKSPTVSASVAKNRKSAYVTFSNLTSVKTVRYMFTYDSKGGPQGASGTIRLKSRTKTLSRRLLFGTCSKNVCTYHKNVTNIKLSVDFTLKSGGVVSFEKKLK
ncbi:MAG: hypothetical protein A2782_03700 [Candidatus Blackburnbacteria bacterium RIFCSPHIGHO2_01_FULL_43_15b]|uniref:CHRD domain-containing protein n=1 Tax=Candidatus Blackburnbacteria bacterium RIFCSPHIGHO2_01_FULL_43_15b TaxID=1797513 RepID=A0A1G1UYC6_9BACT|nr:MAG: hypothetical protein A2782_03700 [Candidatus Blackburnbacteria bacterium RIFCSPHIGHO2_01_FULL_43_15b]